MGEPGMSFHARSSLARWPAAFALMLILALQSLGLHAEIVFQPASQPRAALKKYSSAADVAAAAGGAVQEVRVMITGEISQKDAEGARAMESLVRSGKHKVAGNVVLLSSEGGDMDASMEIGRIFRKLGIYTLIGKSDQCLSACVFAFMGGERRVVAGQLGIHRPYFPFTQDAGDRQAKFRHLQKVVRNYVDEMDFPASFYEEMMLVPPETMKILDQPDLKRFYLMGISPSSEDVADAAAARRLKLSMFDYLQRKAKAPACAFPVPGKSQCGFAPQEVVALGSASEFAAGLQKTAAAPADANATGARAMREEASSESR
jgi:hypothetical protein